MAGPALPGGRSVLTSWTLAAAFAALCCAPAMQDTVTFKTLDRGGQSGIEEAREAVARSAAEWTALWSAHSGGRPRPAVDFTKSMVVAVFAGTRPTGGHSVDITKIARDGGALVVTWRERTPGADEIVTQVITMPYHIVSIDRAAAEVRFVREK
jgi:hypothetical protein